MHNQPPGQQPPPGHHQGHQQGYQQPAGQHGHAHPGAQQGYGQQPQWAANHHIGHWGHQHHFTPQARQCPRCSYPMDVQVSDKGVHVDHCMRCGGTFLDWGEAAHVVGEKADPHNWRREAFARPPQPSHLPCPAGHGPMWSYLLAWEDKQVEIDSCGACNGLWLDANEAEALKHVTDIAHAEHNRPGASKGTAGVVGMYVLQLVTSIPIEVYNPVKRKPILVHGLVVALSVIFVLEIAAISQMGENVLDWVAFVPKYFQKGYVHTLITYAFLHGSIFHLLGNLYFLWIFGDNVEDRLGRKRFILLYLVTAATGALAHWVGNLGSDEAMVGASGAIAGLMGAYLILFPRVKVWVVLFFIPLKIRAIWYFLIWVGMQFLLMLDPNSNVAWLAHLGGFVFGAGIAKLMTMMEAKQPNPAPA